MLPKIWKKLLLAICIIACLFNVTAKLVNRISLEKVISTQTEGVDVRKILNITDEKPNVTNSSVYNVSDNEQVVDKDIDEETPKEGEEQPIEEPVEEPSEETEQQDGQDGEEGKGSVNVSGFIDKVTSNTSKFTDFVQN